MTPSAVLTIIFGFVLLYGYAWEVFSNTVWLHTKLWLVVILVVYHVYCGKLLKDFKFDRNQKSHVYYRWFNEFPVLLLIAIIILVIVKPG